MLHRLPRLLLMLFIIIHCRVHQDSMVLRVIEVSREIQDDLVFQVCNILNFFFKFTWYLCDLLIQVSKVFPDVKVGTAYLD